MAGKEIAEHQEQLMVPSPPPLVVGIAIDGKSKSKYIVRWALDKFIPEGKVIFKLLHVHPRITGVPTPSKFSSALQTVRVSVMNKACRFL